MRRSALILPALLTVALGAYLWPQRPTPQVTQTPAPTVPTTLPNALPEDVRARFQAARPATVRVDSVNPMTRTGGLGTGFFVGPGEVLTAYHVVSAGQLFAVTTLGGRSQAARVVGFDEAADVALLRTEGQPTGSQTSAAAPVLTLAGQPPAIGTPVLAIGNSRGSFLQPRVGKLLRLGARAASSDFPQGTLEMNAPLAQGDSGGPVLNEAGQVIGVVSYVRVDGAGQTRASYAVPVPAGGDLITALRAGEKRASPLSTLIGLSFDQMHSGRTDPPGAVVLRVTPGSAADRAGLQGCRADAQGQLTGLGDIILSVGGVRTPDAGSALEQLKGSAPGERLEVTFLRGGETLNATLELRDRPRAESETGCRRE